MKKYFFSLNFAHDQSIFTLENEAVWCTRDTGVAQSSSHLSKLSLIRFMFLVMNYNPTKSLYLVLNKWEVCPCVSAIQCGQISYEVISCTLLLP